MRPGRVAAEFIRDLEEGSQKASGMRGEEGRAPVSDLIRLLINQVNPSLGK